MTGLRTLSRALLHRVGISVAILLIALSASVAATIGPTYYVAAKHSILQDSLESTDVVGRGVQSVDQGQLKGRLEPLLANVTRASASVLGGDAEVNRLFRSPVLALETLRFFAGGTRTIPLVWRTDVCAHLHFRSGRCPTAADEITIAASTASITKWRVGQQVKPQTTPALTITGIYDAPRATDDYWFARGSLYFSNEIPSTLQEAPYDAMFTPRATIDALPGNVQGNVVVSRTLDIPNVQPSDVDPLSRLGLRLSTAPVLLNTATTSDLALTAEAVHKSWSALSVPVAVVTAELLVLTWLLLFLVVTDAVEARGSEIALAKLRGYGAARAVVFGLAEPASLLLLALPAGALLGWLATKFLATVLLRAHTPVGLPTIGWAAALAASVGGVAAVVVAGRRTLTRPVVEEWRRASRHATDRSWVFDAIVLTAAVAGLAQLLLGGSLDSTRHSAVALLVPGLMGLAVAVVGSRLLPLACRALFSRTRRRGSLGPFLAVRHVARRPGATRTTMILATAVALATFSVASWSIGTSNRTRVADVTVGAPTVLGVVPTTTGVRLATVVDRIDPSGRHATAVESYFSGDVNYLAVEPTRFARIANWSAAGVDNAESVLADLHPPAAPEIVLDGTAVRVRMQVRHLDTSPLSLTMDVVAPGGFAPTPVELGSVRSGQTVTRVGSLPGCPCVVRDIQISPVTAGPVTGAVVLTGVEVRTATGWQPVDISAPGHWVDTDNQQSSITSGGAGITWTFFATKAAPPTLRVHDRPEPLPAVVVGSIAPQDTETTVTGLDGAPTQVAIVDRVHEVPGAPNDGVVVDLDYAERAAYRNVLPATDQVWVSGPAEPIARALEENGFAVTGSVSSGALNRQLSRQGPALASVLFLADAAAAALLAGLAAILSLSAAARRRRYEYAALGAAGADRRTLFHALAIEQAAVVVLGALAGIVAGLAAIAVAGRNVPEFVTAPGVALHYRPSLLLLMPTLVGGVVVLLAAALAAAGALLRSVSPEQLRESPT